MNDAAAAEWIRIAAGALEGFRLEFIEIGCRTAQRTCSHHGKILPTITAECERLEAERARVSSMGAPIRADRALPPPEFKPTPDEIASNERWLNAPGQADMRSAGLKCGALESVNGKVRYRPA